MPEYGFYLVFMHTMIVDVGKFGVRVEIKTNIHGHACDRNPRLAAMSVYMYTLCYKRFGCGSEAGGQAQGCSHTTRSQRAVKRVAQASAE